MTLPQTIRKGTGITRYQARGIADAVEKMLRVGKSDEQIMKRVAVNAAYIAKVREALGRSK